MQATTPSLLITDDDRDFRETMREVFEPRGYRTFLAGDGEEALHILNRETIHVAVFDLHMPRLDGLKAVERARETRISIPFILLTSALDDQLLQAARQLQLFAALSKPISCSDITRIVREAFVSRVN
jgi:CheY-like chemotaxis protein